MSFSSSCINMLAMVKFDVEIYNLRSLPSTKGTKTNEFARNFLMSLKASWYSCSYQKSTLFFSSHHKFLDFLLMDNKTRNLPANTPKTHFKGFIF